MIERQASDVHYEIIMNVYVPSSSSNSTFFVLIEAVSSSSHPFTGG